MRVLVCFLLLGISGCESLQFKTNADDYISHKIQTNVRASGVDIYTNQEVWKQGGQQVGYVETEYCRIKRDDLMVSNNELVKSLKVKTQQLGGNALVVDSCIVNTSMASCLSHKLCRGIAYNIEYLR